MLRHVLSRACPKSLLGLQPFGAAAALYSVQIVVPALGDSISDGTIATVLKKAGDSVSENETIAQVETDKVTIDIKAPSEGTLVGVVVQEQDTVVPGQLVATLDDAAAKAKLVGGSPAPSAADPQPSSAAAAPAASTPATPAPAAAAGEHHQHRVPGIRFPPRITADGRRISELPAAEAAAVTQQLAAAAAGAAAGGTALASGHHSHTPGATAPAAATGGSGHSISSGSSGQDSAAFAAWAAKQQRQSSLAGGSGTTMTDAPSKFATSVTRLNAMPQRRELSDKDIELIELGGAAP